MARLDAEMLDEILTTLREYAGKNLSVAKLLEIELGHDFPEKIMKDLYDPGQLGLHLLFIPEEYGGIGGGPTTSTASPRPWPGSTLALPPACSPSSSAPIPSPSAARPSKRQWMARSPSRALLRLRRDRAAGRQRPRRLATTAVPVEEDGKVVGYQHQRAQAVDQQRRRGRPLHRSWRRRRAAHWFFVDKGYAGLHAGQARRQARHPRSEYGRAVPARTCSSRPTADRRRRGPGPQQAQAVFGYTRLMVAAFGLGAGGRRWTRHPLLPGARAGRRAAQPRSRATRTS